MSDAHELHTATPSQAVRADAAMRAQRAWAARVGGATWAQAAELAGYADASTACRGVRMFFGTLPSIDAEEQRRLWRERLETLWRYADRDAKKGKPGALRAGVAVAQRASALDGLDAAQRVEIGGTAELHEMVRALLAAQGDPMVLEASVWDDGDAADAEMLDD